MSKRTKKIKCIISISVTTTFGGDKVFSPKVEIKNMDIKKQRMNFMFPRK
jgi:hypothetical protein